MKVKHKGKDIIVFNIILYNEINNRPFCEIISNENLTDLIRLYKNDKEFFSGKIFFKQKKDDLYFYKIYKDIEYKDIRDVFFFYNFSSDIIKNFNFDTGEEKNINIIKYTEEEVVKNFIFQDEYFLENKKENKYLFFQEELNIKEKIWIKLKLINFFYLKKDLNFYENIPVKIVYENRWGNSNYEYIKGNQEDFFLKLRFNNKKIYTIVCLLNLDLNINDKIYFNSIFLGLIIKITHNIKKNVTEIITNLFIKKPDKNKEEKQINIVSEKKIEYLSNKLIVTNTETFYEEKYISYY